MEAVENDRPPWHRRRIPALAFVSRHRAGVVLGLGVAVRVAQFLSDRGAWMDEVALAENLRRLSPMGLLGPLDRTQLAPPGFLILEWLARRTLGFHYWSLRLVPLLGGIGSLFLFDRLSRHYLRPTPAMIALALFAVSDDLIYYASELKPYSTDVTAALGCSLMGLATASGRLTARRAAAFGLLGGAAVWCAYPSAFVLAGVGTTLFGSAILDRDWRRAGALAMVGLAWLAAFAGLYRVSMTQLGPSGAMWRFWAGAFPPEPAGLVGTLGWIGRRCLYLFVNPLNLSNPLDPRLGLVPGLILFGIGSAALIRRCPRSFALIALPGVFALLASGLKLYPFHGRLALFDVPYLLLAIAAGAGRLREGGARGVAWALILGVLFLLPTADALYRVLDPRDHGDFNPYGDRRPARLDPTRFPF